MIEEARNCHAPGPSGFGTTLVWFNVFDADPLEFDDDLFDAEVEVERLGIGEFNTNDVCRVLGVQRLTIMRLKAEGAIPLPFRSHHDPGEPLYASDVWTPRQMAEILVVWRRRREPTHYECGTNQAYRAHRMRGEPIDEACLEARRWTRYDLKLRREREMEGA